MSSSRSERAAEAAAMVKAALATDGPATRSEIEAYVRRFRVEHIPHTHLEHHIFVERCRAAGLYDYFTALDLPYRKALEDHQQGLRDAWLALPVASRVRFALEQKTDDAVLVAESMRRASWVGAMDLVNGTAVNPERWAGILWARRGDYDLSTLLAFVDIVDPLPNATGPDS